MKEKSIKTSKSLKKYENDCSKSKQQKVIRVECRGVYQFENPALSAGDMEKYPGNEKSMVQNEEEIITTNDQ